MDLILLVLVGGFVCIGFIVVGTAASLIVGDWLESRRGLRDARNWPHEPK